MSRFLKPIYQKMEAYVPGEQPRDMQYIKLNTNESPFPPAPQVQQVINGEEVALLRLYSDPTCKILKEKLAALYDVSPENIYLSNGSDDILNFAFMAFGHNGAAFPDISYGFYKVFGDLHDIPYIQIPLKEDFTVDYRDYCGLNKLIVIANPNAPTGIQLPVEQIEQILKTNPDTVVLIDEAYVDFGGESCYPLIHKYENLLVVRTFSKSRQLAGARLGYAMGSEELIGDLNRVKFSFNPYNVNRLTSLLGALSMNDKDWFDTCRNKIINTRKYTTEQLRARGFEVLDSLANFIFAKPCGISGEDYYLKLKENGVLVRYFNKDRIRDYVRITIGTDEEMQTLIEKTDMILKECKK